MFTRIPTRPRPLSCLKVVTLTIALLSGAIVRSEDVTTYNLSIPSLPLVDALLEFSTQAEIGLLMGEGTGNSTLAPPLEGNFSAAAALELLLAGTDLRVTWVDDKNVSITQNRPPASPDGEREVAVIGSRLSGGGASAPIRGYSLKEIERLLLEGGFVIPSGRPAGTQQDSEIRNDEAAKDSAR
ncbi:hypothetical protein ACFPN2_24845 [Steroidobacter flavus]|uniref:Secretin/TonB short N-terminal domain-containing protein n=1 Tax=Steroidobacter flavus TaxID=1842136 RepID=A0ABV8SXK6_9GAMM